MADPAWVYEHEVAAFDYIAFKENIAIGLAIADLLDIPRSVAMRGMVEADGDPGVLRLQSTMLADKTVTWANLFAVNDRQSIVAVMEAVLSHQTADTTMVGILNNRLDRADRALQFADIVISTRAPTTTARPTSGASSSMTCGFTAPRAWPPKAPSAAARCGATSSTAGATAASSPGRARSTAWSSACSSTPTTG